MGWVAQGLMQTKDSDPVEPELNTDFVWRGVD